MEEYLPDVPESEDVLETENIVEDKDNPISNSAGIKQILRKQ